VKRNTFIFQKHVSFLSEKSTFCHFRLQDILRPVFEESFQPILGIVYWDIRESALLLLHSSRIACVYWPLIDMIFLNPSTICLRIQRVTFPFHFIYSKIPDGWRSFYMFLNSGTLSSSHGDNYEYLFKVRRLVADIQGEGKLPITPLLTSGPEKKAVLYKIALNTLRCHY
jgi:hypothetical protein